MTLAERALDGPKSLEDFKNCCHHAAELAPPNCSLVGPTGPVGAGRRGEAAVVPQEATKTTAKKVAAPVAFGRRHRQARGRRARVKGI
jgi:hypothetical protein